MCGTGRKRGEVWNSSPFAAHCAGNSSAPGIILNKLIALNQLFETPERNTLPVI